MSQAAKIAGITLFEMEQFLIGQGFKSEYSLENLKEELDLIKI